MCLLLCSRQSVNDTGICPPAQALKPLCSHIRTVSTSRCCLLPQPPALFQSGPPPSPPRCRPSPDPPLQLCFPGTRPSLHSCNESTTKPHPSVLLRSSHRLPRPQDAAQPSQPNRPRPPSSPFCLHVTLPTHPKRQPLWTPFCSPKTQAVLVSRPYVLVPLCETLRTLPQCRLTPNPP